eukprot:COSAG05_NODE_1074_length_5958_cov_5.368152_7_plen_81_part_00
MIFNPALEHSRDYHYWADYDLISNTFAEESLRLMADAALRANDSASQRTFVEYRHKIQAGLNTSLSYVVGDGASHTFHAS